MEQVQQNITAIGGDTPRSSEPDRSSGGVAQAVAPDRKTSNAKVAHSDAVTGAYFSLVALLCF